MGIIRKVLQDQYQFLDKTLPTAELIKDQDANLDASKAFHDFLNILQKNEESGSRDLDRIQKELSEKFTSWSKMSQLRVGFLMYLDKRIEADDYLLKVDMVEVEVDFEVNF